jgi:hydroxymethylglutaryl-CoA reductase
MRLHARQVALAAGAAEDQVEYLARQLARENNIRVSRAREILQDGNF